MVLLQIEKEEQAAAEKAVGKEEFQGEWSAPAAEFTQPEVADWSEGVAVPSVPIQQFPAGMLSFEQLNFIFESSCFIRLFTVFILCSSCSSCEDWRSLCW